MAKTAMSAPPAVRPLNEPENDMRQILICLVLVSCTLGSDLRAQSKTVESGAQAKGKRIELQWERLDLKKLENLKYEDLPRFGVLPPEKQDHERGKGLILMVLTATAFFKGDWMLAYGLLGTTMLRCDVLERIAYRSLFLSLVANPSYKLYSSSLSDNVLLADFRFREGSYTPVRGASVILLRESVIYALSKNLESRYIYNAEGNYGRSYLPQFGRREHEGLLQTFRTGLDLFKKVKGRGFTDCTLRDALGVAHAALDFDAVGVEAPYELGKPLQIYSDALEGTLKVLGQKPDHSANFLEELGRQMDSRGLAAIDHLLDPVLDADDKPEAMVRLINDDLDQIGQATNRK